MHDEFLKVVQIIFADIILSGDNALVIGMAAAGLSGRYRRWAIMLGMALAAILRIVFAVMASFLLKYPETLFLGGVLLCWVCWRFFKDIRATHGRQASEAAANSDSNSNPEKQFFKALVTIAIADISMSIDNVLAVAAVARDNTHLLVFGLVLAIALMALCATMIMRVLQKYPILSYVGLAFLCYLAAKMLYDGSPAIFPDFLIRFG